MITTEESIAMATIKVLREALLEIYQDAGEVSIEQKAGDALALPVGNEHLRAFVVKQIVDWYWSDNATENDVSAVRKYVNEVLGGGE